MLKVDIENVQSIGKASLEVEGFTAIVGKTNVGKSAILRAIGAAMTNPPLGSLLRKDASECKVKIDSEGFCFEWVKGKKGKYIIDNSLEYKEIGREVPVEITDAGFRSVEYGDSKMSVMYGSQFDPIFLLNRSGTEVGNLISSITKIDAINKASQDCSKDFSRSKKELKKKEKELTSIKNVLGLFGDLDCFSNDIKSIEINLKKSADLEKELALLEQYIGDLEHVEARLFDLGSIDGVSATPVHLDDEFSILEDLSSFESQYSELSRILGELAVLEGVNVPTELFSDQYESFSELECLCEDYFLLTSRLEKFDNLEDSHIQHLDVDEGISELEIISDYFSSLSERATVYRDSKKELENCENNLVSLAEEKQELELSIKTCPLCDRGF